MPSLLIRKEFAGACYGFKLLEPGDTVVGSVDGRDTLVQVGEGSQLRVNCIDQTEPDPVIFDVQPWRTRRVITPVSKIYAGDLQFTASQAEFPFSGPVRGQICGDLVGLYRQAWEASGREEPQHRIDETVVGFAVAVILS